MSLYFLSQNLSVFYFSLTNMNVFMYVETHKKLIQCTWCKSHPSSLFSMFTGLSNRCCPKFRAFLLLPKSPFTHHKSLMSFVYSRFFFFSFLIFKDGGFAT